MLLVVLSTTLLEKTVGARRKNKNTVLVLVPVRTKKWYRVQTRIKNITEEEKKRKLHIKVNYENCTAE
jgi:hypothetical protein